MELLLSALSVLGAALGLVGLLVLLVGAVVTPLTDGDLGRPRRRGTA